MLVTDWYPADLGTHDLKGLYGYKVLLAVSLIPGEGFYDMIKIIAITINEMCNKSTKLVIVNEIRVQTKKDYLVLKDKTPTCFAAAGYVGVGLAAISTATVPISSGRILLPQP